MAKNQPHPGDKVARVKPVTPAAAAPAPAAGTSAAPARGAGLAGLGGLRDALKGESERRERERVAAAEAERVATADANVFRHALGGAIKPLAPSDRIVPGRVLPTPVAKHTLDAEAEVLNASLSDEFDPETLLDTDDSLYYQRPGLGADVVRKLRAGAWVVQAQIDLHGMRRDEAREALADFIRASAKQGLRCLRVIHGKGLGSVGKEPVLKGKVRAWLVQKEEVLAFCEARPNDGGAGAVLVLLQGGRSGN
jgi:DNA-nicking Smr family endonuclease